MELTCLLRFKRKLDSLATRVYPSMTSNLIGAFIAGIRDLVTLLGSAKYLAIDLLNELSFELIVHIV